MQRDPQNADRPDGDRRRGGEFVGAQGQVGEVFRSPWTGSAHQFRLPPGGLWSQGRHCAVELACGELQLDQVDWGLEVCRSS
ncbi:MAG: hypothetical protein ACLU9S_13860 [Oscillospiraceae bacterium]